MAVLKIRLTNGSDAGNEARKSLYGLWLKYIENIANNEILSETLAARERKLSFKQAFSLINAARKTLDQCTKEKSAIQRLIPKKKDNCLPRRI